MKFPFRPGDILTELRSEEWMRPRDQIVSKRAVCMQMVCKVQLARGERCAHTPEHVRFVPWGTVVQARKQRQSFIALQLTAASAAFYSDRARPGSDTAETLVQKNPFGSTVRLLRIGRPTEIVDPGGGY